MSSAIEKNILAIKQHSEETRKLVRSLQQKLDAYDTLNTRVNNIEQQVKNIQVKLYTGGPTDGH